MAPYQNVPLGLVLGRLLLARHQLEQPRRRDLRRVADDRVGGGRGEGEAGRAGAADGGGRGGVDDDGRGGGGDGGGRGGAAGGCGRVQARRGGDGLGLAVSYSWEGEVQTDPLSR